MAPVENGIKAVCLFLKMRGYGEADGPAGWVMQAGEGVGREWGGWQGITEKR